jgi:hypothetical protein
MSDCLPPEAFEISAEAATEQMLGQSYLINPKHGCKSQHAWEARVEAVLFVAFHDGGLIKTGLAMSRIQIYFDTCPLHKIA